MRVFSGVGVLFVLFASVCETLYGVGYQDVSMTVLAAQAHQWLEEDSGRYEPDALVRRLHDYQDRDVAVRGFLHYTADGDWLLASQASLKSCCIGDHDLATFCAVLDRPLEKSLVSQVVEVTGRLVVDPQWERDGSLSRLYRIEGAQMIDLPTKRSVLFPVVALVGIATCVAGGILYWNRRASLLS